MYMSLTVYTYMYMYFGESIHSNPSAWDVRNLVEYKYVQFGVLHKYLSAFDKVCVCVRYTIPCTGH